MSLLVYLDSVQGCSKKEGTCLKFPTPVLTASGVLADSMTKLGGQPSPVSALASSLEKKKQGLEDYRDTCQV